MRTRDGFELRQVGDEHVVITIGDAVACFNGMIKLNRTGAFIWEKMGRDIDLGQLVENLAREYAVDMAKAELDVKTFLDSVRPTGCVIEEQGKADGDNTQSKAANQEEQSTGEKTGEQSVATGYEAPRAEIIDFDDESILAISFSYKDGN